MIFAVKHSPASCNLGSNNDSEVVSGVLLPLASRFCLRIDDLGLMF